MKPPIRLVASAAIIAMAEFFCFHPGIAQQDRKTQNPSALEAGLERRFETFREECNLRWRSNNTDDKKLTSLPRRLRARVQVNRSVDATWIDRGARALFTYVFPSDSLQTTTRLPERVLPTSLVGPNDIPEADSLETSNVYSQTCVTLARIAVRGDLTNIPIATVKAAANRDDSVDGALTLAQGRFNSPLRARLRDRGPDGLLSSLQLWDYYVDNRTALFGNNPSPVRYVTSFTGILFVENTVVNSIDSLSAKASAKADWLVGSLQLDAELSAQRANQMRSRTFDTYFFTYTGGKPIVTWESLPNPRAIRDRLTKAEPREVGTDPKVIRNVPVTVERQIEGIPEPVCNRDRWQLSSSDQRIRNGRPVYRNDSCIFSVEFTATTDAANYDLTYRFVEKTPLGSDTLVVPFALRLSATPHPILRTAPDFQRSVSGQSDPLTGRKWVQWNVPVEFIDTEAPVEFSVSPEDGIAELRCGSAAPDTMTASFVSADQNKRTFRYTVERQLPAGESFTSTAGQYAVCDLRVMVRIPIKNRPQPAERTLFIRDVVLPQITTAPPAGTQTVPTTP